MSAHHATPQSPPPSLCHVCVHLRTVTSARGSRFLLCRRAATDARFQKYPRQPMWQCSGYERRDESAGAADTSADAPEL